MLVFKSKKGENPFPELKKLFARFKAEKRKGEAVGYFSYDLKDFTERLPGRAVDDLDIPDCILRFYEPFRMRDSLINRFYKESRIRNGNPSSIPLTSTFTKPEYIRAVLKAKEYIKRGDIYQVNLSQRFKTDFDGDAFELYKTLCAINPAPYAAFLDFGGFQIVSASPERFLKIDGRRIETRPIKGTRPRGKTPEEDTRLKNELIASAKDRAENLMIIDLERNDLGRICEYGSVRVTDYMAVEEHPTVFHLVSTVEGTLREDVGPIDALMNCFPGGSITGAPKIRSMEIIEELEPVKRSIYTGCIGRIGFDGSMDMSIAIRTILIKDKTAYFHAGGGIVHDSDPESEYQETLDKAKALKEALASVSKQKIPAAV